MYTAPEHSQQPVMFYNRLKKRYRHLKKQTKRFGIYAFRLYDKDIPEIPVAVDIYIEDKTERIFAILTEYACASRKSNKAAFPFEEFILPLCRALDIPEENVYTKRRKRQRGEAQYEKITDNGKRIIVREGKCRFLINLSGYLDTGLFPDHRPARLFLSENAVNKTVLNLFCYTAAFSIHMLMGGAREVCSVDLSKNYLQWAQKNARLNNVYDPVRCSFVQSDVRLFLKQAALQKKTWDIIICDPPTFSNSKRMPQFLDLNRDWVLLIHSCCKVLAAGGILYFSTNSRSLRFSTAALCSDSEHTAGSDCFVYNNTVFTVEDISLQSIPEDFRNKKIHRLWKITKPA